MKRRVFIALPISVQLQKKIAIFEKDWQHLPVRFLEGKNLHITLIPPWYVDDVNEVINLLKSNKNLVDPFKIAFEEITFGPDFKKPRLIWAQGVTPQEIIFLKTQLKKILKKKREMRNFLLHLTLARFKPQDFSSFPVKTLKEKVSWQEQIRSFVLMESHLTRTGASYEVLLEIPL